MMGGASLYLSGALALSVAGSVALGIVQERRIAAIKTDLAGATARLNTCEEVQGIRDAVENLSIQDLVNSLTRRAP